MLGLSQEDYEAIGRALTRLVDAIRENRQVTDEEFDRILHSEGVSAKGIELLEEAVSKFLDFVQEIREELQRTAQDVDEGAIQTRFERELSLARHFTTPTGLLPLIPTFGGRDAGDGKLRDAGRLEVKRWIFLPQQIENSETQERQVQLDLPFREYDEGVEPLERQLRLISDPLGLKVILGVLHLCHNNRRRNWFRYEPNDFADLLGYKRDSRGYHLVRNRGRLESRIQTFFKARYKCEWTGGRNERVPLEMSLLLLDPNSTVKWIVDDVELRHGQIIYFCGPLYDDIVKNNMYSWMDSRFLQLDADRYGRVIQLGTYYSTAWRIDWNNSKGKLHRRLRTILSDSGIPLGAKHRNLHRMIDKVKGDHDFMAKQGFIKEWSVVQRASNPLDEIWEIVIPDDHGMLVVHDPREDWFDDSWREDPRNIPR